MKRLYIYGIMLVPVLMLIGCGVRSVSLNPEATKRVVKTVPDWYNSPSDFIPEGYIGSRATDTSRDMMTADEKAQNAARGALRLQIEDIGETGNDRFVRETGLDEASEMVKRFEGTNRSASDAVLKNTKVHKSETHVEEEIYRAFVLIITPDPELELLRQLEQDAELMAKFEATEYYGDLSERLEKYRARANAKKNQ